MKPVAREEIFSPTQPACCQRKNAESNIGTTHLNISPIPDTPVGLPLSSPIGPCPSSRSQSLQAHPPISQPWAGKQAPFLAQQNRLYMEGCTCLIGILGCIPCFLGLGMGHLMQTPIPSLAQGTIQSLAQCAVQLGVGMVMLHQASTTFLQGRNITRLAQFGDHQATIDQHLAEKLQRHFPQEQAPLQALQIAARAKGRTFAWAQHEQRFRMVIGGLLQGFMAGQLVRQVVGVLQAGGAHGLLCHTPWMMWIQVAYCGLLGLRHGYYALRAQKTLQAIPQPSSPELAHFWQLYRRRMQPLRTSQSITSLAWLSSAICQVIPAMKIPLWIANNVSFLHRLLPPTLDRWAVYGIHLGAMGLGAQRQHQYHTSLPDVMDWTQIQQPSLLAYIEHTVRHTERLHHQTLNELWQSQSFRYRILYRGYERWSAPMCGPTSSLALALALTQRKEIQSKEQWLLLRIMHSNTLMMQQICHRQSHPGLELLSSSLGRTLAEQQQERQTWLEQLEQCQQQLKQIKVLEQQSIHDPVWLRLFLQYTYSQGSLAELLSATFPSHDPIFQRLSPQPYPIPTLCMGPNIVDELLSADVCQDPVFFQQLVRHVITPYRHKAKRDMIDFNFLPSLLLTQGLSQQQVQTPIRIASCCAPA